MALYALYLTLNPKSSGFLQTDFPQELLVGMQKEGTIHSNHLFKTKEQFYYIFLQVIVAALLPLCAWG